VRRRDGALKAATRCRTPNEMFPEVKKFDKSVARGLFNEGLNLSYYQRKIEVDSPPTQPMAKAL